MLPVWFSSGGLGLGWLVGLMLRQVICCVLCLLGFRFDACFGVYYCLWFVVCVALLTICVGGRCCLEVRVLGF